MKTFEIVAQITASISLRHEKSKTSDKKLNRPHLLQGRFSFGLISHALVSSGLKTKLDVLSLRRLDLLVR